MAVTNIPNITNWSVTPQNGQVGYFTLMNTWLSESAAVLASLQTAINAQNTANSEINDLAIQTENNANIAASVGNYQGVWSNLVTYSKSMGVSVGNLYYISKVNSNLNHAVTDTNYWLYNPINDKLDKDFSVLADKTTPSDSDIFATRETGGLLKKISWANSKATLKTYFDSLYMSLTGNQTIAGVKTFSSPIRGNFIGTVSFSGSTGSAYDNSNILINGNGTTNTIKPSIGFHQANMYAGTLSMLDAYTFQFKKQDGQPATLSNNITGNADTATFAADSNKLVGKNWYWSGQGGQPTWLWGGSDDTNMYVYNPSNFNVNTAVSLSTAVGSAPSYACRAWVNFNGTGTVAIRASGNVSSITDNGVGNYTVNFTTAMPDANYSLAGIASVSGIGGTSSSLVLTEGLAASNTYALKTTSAITVYTIDNNTDALFDAFSANVSIFR